MATFLAWLGIRYQLTTEISLSSSSTIIQNFFLFNTLTAIYLLILLLLAISMGYLLSQLIHSRNILKEIFRANEIDYN